MDPYYENEDNLTGEECEDPHCHGCQKPIEDGSVVQFGDGIWHFECFRCAKCHKLVECYSNLLLLRDGSPICEDCSYSCHACKKTIKDEAIMTGDEAYHADCFRCVQCSKKIDDLVFTQTSKGIYCTKCHEARKLLRLKRRDERNNSKTVESSSSTKPVLPLSILPDPGFDISSTASIVGSYAEDSLKAPILESNDITELNDMLMAQRSSEETLRNSLDTNGNSNSNISSSANNIENLDDTTQVKGLKRELNDTKSRLKEVEAKFLKIKTISRKALDEFHVVKDGYAVEVIARREAERLGVRLKSEVQFYQQASIFNGQDFIHYSKEEIEDLNQTRADLEQVCHDLRNQRDNLLYELENHSNNIEKLLASQKPQDLHWERLQFAYQQQLDLMQKDIAIAKGQYSKLMKGREDIISDMILLNAKNAELTQLNNDLSKRVMEKEQEAKSVFSGMNFLTPSDQETKKEAKTKHKRNLSTGSIAANNSNSNPSSASTSTVTLASENQPPKIAQRDSFSGSAAPKLFKFRRNRSGSKPKPKASEEKLISVPYESRSLEQVSEAFSKKEVENVNNTHSLSNTGSSAMTPSNSNSGNKHRFTTTKFIKPTKCETCSEKMWRINELKCSDCGIACHSKCAYSVPQTCSRKISLDGASRPDDARYMFGNDLIRQIHSEKGKVPLIVEKCIDSVESRGMDYEGIYRKSGGVGQMRQIQQAFEKGEAPNLIDEERWNDICAITSVLKQYFRELPNPLFTYELHEKFMDSMKPELSGDQLSIVNQLIQCLPIENFNTLKYLMEHLNRVQQRNKENLMTAKNLAVIFGPTLLRDPNENLDLIEMNFKIALIEFILNHMDRLFVIETISNTPSIASIASTAISASSTTTASTATVNSLAVSNHGPTLPEHRKMHLPPLQRGEDFSSLLVSYQPVDNSQVNGKPVPLGYI